MIVETLSGTSWHIVDAEQKLAWRAELPGARLYDLAAESLRKSKAAGVPRYDRLVCALPASWLVNSPAISKVLRRWALPPQNEVCLALVEMCERIGPQLSTDTSGEITRLLKGLGDEPYVVEAVSKVLALLVPHAVPLMPPLACKHVLGSQLSKDSSETFCEMIQWFAEAVAAHEQALHSIARQHREVSLEPAQVLDRLLWFDSDGHRNFKHR